VVLAWTRGVVAADDVERTHRSATNAMSSFSPCSIFSMVSI